MTLSISRKTGATLFAALLLGSAPTSLASAKTVVHEARFGRLSYELYYGTITSGTDGTGHDVSGQRIVAEFVADTLSSVTQLGGLQAHSTNFVSSDAFIRFGGDGSRDLGDRIAYLDQDSTFFFENYNYGNPLFDAPPCQICGSRSDFAYSPLGYHQTIFSLAAGIFTQNGIIGASLPDPHDPFPANFTDYVDYRVRPGDKATGTYAVENGPALASGAFTIDRFVGGSAEYRLRFFDDGTNVQDVVFLHAAEAPEPSAWILMIAGLGGVGAALRKRRAAALSGPTRLAERQGR